MKISIILLGCFFIILSCHHDESYSPLLLNADSAFIHGFYDKGKSFLIKYDSSEKSEKKSERMYRQLLRLTQKYVADTLTDTDISLADSLYRYYETFGTIDKRIRAGLFLANIYKRSGNYPASLQYCLKAESEASEYAVNPVLLCWINQDIGDLYFIQKMYEDCQNHYKKFYLTAQNNNDSLRIAHAAERMGLVHTINSDIDSIVFYYKKAIEYGQNIEAANNTVVTATRNLCDIYIQIEEFDSASAIMPHDDKNMDNWGYWHLGQNQQDSAKYYFQSLLEVSNLYAKAEFLRILIQIEEENKHQDKALAYYDRLIAVEDSIKEESQTEETRKIKAQYNFTTIQQERDDIAKRYQTIKWWICVIMIVLCTVTYNIWNTYKRRKERELSYEKILRQRKDAQYRQSQKQIQDNQKRIEALSRQLADINQQNDPKGSGKLELEKEMLNIQNLDIETTLRHKAYIRKEFETSDLFARLKMSEDNQDCHMSTEDWKALADYMDAINDHFTSRLLSLANLSQTEIRLCYLVKLGVSPIRIASLLFITKSAVSKIRSRLYQKLTGQKGSSSQFDVLIRNF